MKYAAIGVAGLLAIGSGAWASTVTEPLTAPCHRAGKHSERFSVVPDRGMALTTPGAKTILAGTSAEQDGAFGTLMPTIDSERCEGQRVRFSAMMSSLMLPGCTAPDRSAAVPQGLSVDGNFEFDGATKVDLPGIPEIHNEIGDAGDDDLRDRVFENKIIETFGGILIEMTADAQPGEKVRISAFANGKFFETESDVSVIQGQDGSILGYLARADFENKFWLGAEDWDIRVNSGGKDILAVSKKLAVATELLSSHFSDSPFVKTNERNLKKEVRYVYRFKNSGDDVVVLYRSEDWENFKSVLMLKPDQNNPDTEIGIKWKNEESKGVYYITHYSKDGLPEKVILTALFDSREVE